MRFGHILLFLTSFALAFGAVPVKKAAPKPTAGKIVPRKAASGGKTVTTRKATVRTRSAAPRGPSYTRQQTPTADRYREIQQALADKGYLKSEANGVWGAESVEALRQFQAEQKIPVTGKLNSRSIIGLGLGAKPAVSSSAPPTKPVPPAVAEATGPAQP